MVDSKANLRDFLCGRVYQVMIIGYEKLRLLQETDELKSASFDIIICDEGHKLKSANNKAAQAIRSLKTTRRIILSGTPIQNDLGEFFVMIDFVNPGLLGSYQTFKKEFENPILRARMPDATKKEKEKGAARSTELSRLTDVRPPTQGLTRWTRSSLMTALHFEENGRSLGRLFAGENRICRVLQTDCAAD